MRSLMFPVAAVALAGVFLALPAQAAHYRYYGHHYGYSKGYGTGPYWQGTPSDHRPIWRYGYYQGNDPDRFIRGQLIRDPRNGTQTW